MERYEAYKDSGIEWIGEIPEGWRCIKLGLISSSTLGRMLDSERQSGECLAPYLSNKDVQWFRFISSDLKEMDFPHETRNSYKIIDGDMLVCEGGEVGRCAVWHGPSPDFFFQKALHRVRFNPSTMNPDFAAYQMFQKAQDTMFREVRKGESTISHLPGDQLSKLIMITPPLAEQRAIADFLDAKTAEIDGLVADCEREVELLQEYRKAVISEAVTKGLDPHAPMKDSGVEWIGEIPEGWGFENLGSHSSMLTPMRDKPSDLTGPIPWVRIEDYDGKYISESKEGYGVSAAVASDMNLKIYPVGTLLCTSSCDLGKCAIVTKELVSNQRFIGIIPTDYNIDYLYYLMLSSAERLNFLSTGTIQANLSRKSFEHLKLPYPPCGEQKSIADFLDAKTAEIDGLIDAKRQMAEKLREYRKSLISEAVTGKFKVPGVA